MHKITEIIFLNIFTFCISVPETSFVVLNRLMGDDITEYILHIHNLLRAQVAQGSAENQPPAQNMLEMRWEEQLAFKAQKHSERCQFSHESQEDRNVGQIRFGQNVATVMDHFKFNDSDPDFVDAIFSWFNEREDYHFGEFKSNEISEKPIQKDRKGKMNSSKTNSLQTTAYTQIVWAKTYMLGCGFAYCMAKDKDLYKKVYVCNYAPGGNIISEFPYIEGKPECHSYHLRYSRIKGLCVPDTVFAR